MQPSIIPSLSMQPRPLLSLITTATSAMPCKPIPPPSSLQLPSSCHLFLQALLPFFPDPPPMPGFGCGLRSTTTSLALDPHPHTPAFININPTPSHKTPHSFIHPKQQLVSFFAHLTHQVQQYPQSLTHHNPVNQTHSLTLSNTIIVSLTLSRQSVLTPSTSIPTNIPFPSPTYCTRPS